MNGLRKLFDMGLYGLGLGLLCAGLSWGCSAEDGSRAGNLTFGGGGGEGSCVDGMQNGAESDVDCGGAACPGCEVAQACRTTDDCVADLTCDPESGTCAAMSCTDGVANGDESDVDCGGTECPACDAGGSCTDGSDCASGVCGSGACQVPMCGDGVINGDEPCDPNDPQIPCNPDCTLGDCGDGEVSPGEDCDAGGQETIACDANCTAVECGDGTLNMTAGETCDDGGESATCDGDCTVAECGDGYLNGVAGESCENGGVESPYCDVDCTVPVCGDGVVNMTAGEACDDGGESAACNADCSVAECGDGQINTTAGETCDDSGESATCDIDCTAPSCGDGVMNETAGESCDDGNLMSDDGCDDMCQAEHPPVCYSSNVGVQSGSDWVVCEASPTGAWLSHGTQGSGGTYDPLAACQSIGYSQVGNFGGTCGNVCSYCTSGSTCMNPGAKNFTGGGTSCGANLLCVTVMWECLP